MSTIFTKIIDREVPGFFVYEDDKCVAIMDRFPAVNGQVLVIPREEVGYIFALSTETYLHICKVSRMVAHALDDVFNTKRTCVVVEGFDVPHVHIRLYPMTSAEEPLGAVIVKQSEADTLLLTEQAEKVKAALDAMQ
tara:strand:+ start:1974 stop:2384 length:411 start_codon:yes stop_codon:yes gene_type:complete